MSRCLRRRLLDRLAALPGLPATGDAVAAALLANRLPILAGATEADLADAMRTQARIAGAAGADAA